MQNVNVGPRIRACREKAGLSQAQLAEAIFATRQTVGNWERGVTLPDIHSLQLLADVFATTVDELLGGDTAELARAAADDRRSLLRSFVIDVACVAVLIALILVRVGLRDRVGSEAVYQGWNLVLLVIQFVALAYMWKATFSRDRVLRAVSYTHLDVYKRQGVPSLARELGPGPSRGGAYRLAHQERRESKQRHEQRDVRGGEPGKVATLSLIHI